MFCNWGIFSAGSIGAKLFNDSLRAGSIMFCVSLLAWRMGLLVRAYMSRMWAGFRFLCHFLYRDASKPNFPLRLPLGLCAVAIASGAGQLSDGCSVQWMFPAQPKPRKNMKTTPDKQKHQTNNARQKTPDKKPPDKKSPDKKSPDKKQQQQTKTPGR